MIFNFIIGFVLSIAGISLLGGCLDNHCSIIFVLSGAIISLFGFAFLALGFLGMRSIEL